MVAGPTATGAAFDLATMPGAGLHWPEAPFALADLAGVAGRGRAGDLGMPEAALGRGRRPGQDPGGAPMLLTSPGWV